MIKYPGGIVKNNNNVHNTKVTNKNKANLGLTFENLINETNLYYLKHNIACIYKKPTPIQVVKVDYPNRSKAKISEAYYKTPSTTDYNGIYKGKYVDFEAKSIKGTIFPLSNTMSARSRIVGITSPVSCQPARFLVIVTGSS